MLRASADKNNESINLLGVGDESIAIGLRGGRALSALTEAAVLRDVHEMPAARAEAVSELGATSTIRALAVAGNFEMMNRLLDAVGVGPFATSRSMGERIGVPLPDRFA